MALALGVPCLDEIVGRIATLLNVKVPDTLLGKLAMLPQLAEVAKFPPKAIGGRAPAQEIVVRDRDVDLSQFPIPVCWPEDGGPYITLPGVITRDPKTGVRNVGMYRIQVIAPNELAMHWQRHKVGAAHWREMPARGEVAPGADLAPYDRGRAADGGLLARSRHGADLPAALEAHAARDRRPPHAGRGDLPQPRVRQHRQAVPGPGVQGDERAVGAGADVACQGDHRPRQGRERARPQGGVVGGIEPHRSRA